MEVAKVVLTDLFIMFLVAKVVGEIFQRLKQPAVIGELLVGIAIGPFGLGWVGVPTDSMIQTFHGAREADEVLHSVLEVLAELGVIVLLFMVGLETRLSDLLGVGPRAGSVAILGVIVPFTLGFGTGTVLGLPFGVSAFLGSAMVATSVGITARVLADLGAITTNPARIVLGAAVIDDILGLIILAIVAGLSVTGQLSILEVALIAGQAFAFTGFVALAGRQAARRWSIHLERLTIKHAPFAVAMILMLGLASLATIVGLAAIIGAFLAGMVFAELREQYEIEHEVAPVYELLVPIFFVITGTRVDWRIFLDPNLLSLALLVTALAILGKLIGCGLGAVGMGWRTMAIVGVGMAPRGEVGLIVANVGRSLGIVSDSIFSVVVVMSILTTLVVPPVLAYLHRPPRATART